MQKISELLINAGTDRVIAGVIEVLADGKWHSMREIERAADLRQPEVSSAISHLAEYVELRNSKGARGRPQKCVRGVKMREYVNERIVATRAKYDKKIVMLSTAIACISAGAQP